MSRVRMTVPDTTAARQDSRRGQARAAIGQPGDRYEREADRVAREVVRGGRIDAAPPRRDGVIPDQVRIPVERALGADFSRVRLHTGDRADRLNRDLRASAFTTGQDIYFRRGAYDPQHAAGQETLAHELAHVVQQQSAGAPAIQCKNEITNTSTDHQKQPISVLHDAFAADFVTAGKKERYKIYDDKYDPAKIDPIFSKGVADWTQPNRPKRIVAKLDGPGPGGKGKRKSAPPQSLYGYLGTVERAMFGRPDRAAPYEGGHFISDEILGKGSYSEYNFAPQDAHLNAPLWRNFEEMALEGPVDEETGDRAPSWTYEVSVQYPADYSLKAQELADVGVIPNVVAALNPNKPVTFPRRIPYLWEGKLDAPADHVFDPQVLNSTTQSHKYYTSPASHIVHHSLTRQGSWELNVGMESLAEHTSAAGTERIIGGNKTETFAATQSYPDTIASQTAGTAVRLGQIPVTPLVAVSKPPKLTKAVNLKTAMLKADSADREEIEDHYPKISKAAWKAIQAAGIKLGQSGTPTPYKVIMEATKAKGVSKPQVKYMTELAKDSKLAFA